MSWKKHFKVVDTNSMLGTKSSLRQRFIGFKTNASNEVYKDIPTIERYNQYETMDVILNQCGSDILAEFSTQANIENKTF